MKSNKKIVKDFCNPNYNLEGSFNNRNLTVTYNNFYSYQQLIGNILVNKRKERIVIVDEYKYSATTTKHANFLLCNGQIKAYRITGNVLVSIPTIIKYNEGIYQGYIQKMSRAKESRRLWMWSADELLKDIQYLYTWADLQPNVPFKVVKEELKRIAA